MRYLLALLAGAAALHAAPATAVATHTPRDFPLTADPHSEPWRAASPLLAEAGPRGEPAPGHRTEIRTRWSPRNLYVLFTCPYENLNLKPNPTTKEETNRLWLYDVAEIFVGADFSRIRRYKEFQVSPQGEWVDLDIDRDNPLPEGGWRWNSGFAVKARLDPERKIWYGEFRIPFRSIDPRPPKKGNELRINFYRIQGPEPARVHVAWQPTGQPSYHVPEAFGLLRLE